MTVSETFSYFAMDIMCCLHVRLVHISTLEINHVLLQVMQVSTAFIVCQEGQLLKEFSDGEYTCMICPKCPPGQGATVHCGSAVPNNVPVTCKACKSGEYSDSFSSESCKRCSSCLPHEAIVAECNNISDTRCSWKMCDSVLEIFYLTSLKELNNLSLKTGLIVMILISGFTYIIRRKNKFNNNGQSSPFPSLKRTEHVVTPQQNTKPGTTEDTSQGELGNFNNSLKISRI